MPSASSARAPGFTIVALITLALGIGANTAVFSVVNTVLLRPLPFADAGRVVVLSEVRPAEGPERGPISAPDFLDWRSMAKSFSALAVHSESRFSVTGSGNPERLPGAAASSGFFEALDRSLPISNIRAMDEYMANSVAPRRFNLVLLGILAGLVVGKGLAMAGAGVAIGLAASLAAAPSWRACCTA